MSKLLMVSPPLPPYILLRILAIKLNRLRNFLGIGNQVTANGANF